MALTQVYELVAATGMAASTQGRGRHLCRLRDQTYAVCYTFLNGANSEIRVRIGEGIGYPWPEEVAAAAGGSNLLYPAMAVDSRDNLHLCYEDNTAGRIYYTKRDHITHAWSTPFDIAGIAGCATPVLAVGPDDQVAVVWTQTMIALGRVRYRERSYAGVWSIAETMDNPAPAAAGHHNWPSIAYDTLGNLHVVSQAHGYGTHPANYQMIYMRRNSGGDYGTQIQPADGDYEMIYGPAIFIDLNNNIWTFCHLPTGGYDLGCWKKSLSATVFDPVQCAKPGLGITGDYPSAAGDQLPGQHVAFSSFNAGVNWGVYISNQHRSCHWCDSHWLDNGNLPHDCLALTADPSHPQLLWAMFPYVNGIHTNIPLRGTAMVFSDDTTLAVYFHTFSGHGNYDAIAAPTWEPWWDDTLTWENTTEVDTVPDLSVLPATAISKGSMVLNGLIADDQGTPCDVCFEYGLTSAYGRSTEIQTGKVSGDAFSAMISGLAMGTTYHFRVKGLWGSQAFYSSDATATTIAPETTLRSYTPASIPGLGI